MKKTLSAALVLFAFSSLAWAQETPDMGVAKRLNELDLSYEVNENGDYTLVFEIDKGRTQLVIVRSQTERLGELDIREVLSAGVILPEGEKVPYDLAIKLLEDNSNRKRGSWAAQGRVVYHVVHLSADANKVELGQAIVMAAKSADDLERQFTGKDDL